MVVQRDPDGEPTGHVSVRMSANQRAMAAEPFDSISVISFVVNLVRADTRRDGCDTPQFYFSYPDADTDPAVPKKVLRYFEKVCVDKATVSFSYTDRDVSNWDVRLKRWEVNNGEYTVHGLPASQGGSTGLSAKFTVG